MNKQTIKHFGVMVYSIHALSLPLHSHIPPEIIEKDLMKQLTEYLHHQKRHKSGNPHNNH